MAKKSNLSIPSVLAFTRRLDPSDGCMYKTRWSDRTDLAPLENKEKTIRTVLSNRVKEKVASDGSLKEQKQDTWQIHGTEYCTLGPDCDTLVVKFTLRVLGGLGLHACNKYEFAKNLEERLKAYYAESGFDTGIGNLGLRYARNIAAGSFLWRNRIGAEQIETVVRDITHGEGDRWAFDSLDVSCDFDEKVDPESNLGKLGTAIASALKSDNDHLLLEVTSYVKIGFGQEVYPSQQMVQNAKKEDKAKLLHSVDGIAALTSQKIGNAIRRIDTWYDRYDEMETPLSVESYGTYTTYGEVFRPKGKSCFYDYFDIWATGGEIAPSARDYVVAMLIRGGVFGEGEA